jgi:hypothetical protein
VTEPAIDRDPERAELPLHCYELRIRTIVSRALTASFRHRVHESVVPRHTVHHVTVGEGTDEVDLPAVVQRLTECDVDVLDVRLCRLPT